MTTINICNNIQLNWIFRCSCMCLRKLILRQTQQKKTNYQIASYYSYVSTDYFKVFTITINRVNHPVSSLRLSIEGRERENRMVRKEKQEIDKTGLVTLSRNWIIYPTIHNSPIKRSNFTIGIKHLLCTEYSVRKINYIVYVEWGGVLLR